MKPEKLSKDDPDYYSIIGSKGGKTKSVKPKGMAYFKLHNPEQLHKWASDGGKISRRPKETP